MGQLFDFQGIANYGIYWDRDKVNWWPGQRGIIQLLGRTWRQPNQFGKNNAAGAVNFSAQSGVYLLHQGQEVVYVGQTIAEAQGGGLFYRLREHRENPTKSPLRDRFSWFGFRPVGENGQLTDVPIRANQAVRIGAVVEALEAILIEAFRPKLNQQGGQLGINYGQVCDPNLPSVTMAMTAPRSS